MNRAPGSLGGGAAGKAFEPPLEDALSSLSKAGFSEAEAYAKRGRSRRLVLATGRRGATYHEEAGWAVRASTDRASLFTCGTGALPAGGPGGGAEAAWPSPDGLPLNLPTSDAVPGDAGTWKEPSDYETPLIGETEGLRLLDALEAKLAEELPAARLLSAWLEDGSSDSRLANGHGISARWRLRVAVLRAEAALGGTRASVELAAREARSFGPSAVARQLADRLVAATAPAADGFTGRDRAEVLLAPALAARLLAALTPLLIGPEAAQRVRSLTGSRGRLGSEALTLVDDGRLPDGVLAAPVDGEGLPTRRVTLVEEGAFRQPLLSWAAAQTLRHREGGGGGKRGSRPPQATGCSRRASWRDVPRAAPSHLHIAADPSIRPVDLLADLTRGYYLLAASAAPRVDWQAGTFHVPVLGYSVREGRAQGPLADTSLNGTLAALLGGIRTAARDLTYFPYDGMIGAPTLRVSALELRARA